MGPQYCVEIEWHKDLWKVVWTVDSLRARAPYFVNPTFLQGTAATIRTTLKRLVALSTRNGALKDDSRSDVVGILNDLMKAGNHLYEFLFTDEMREAQGIADGFKFELARRTDRPQIWFKVASDMNIPWALMTESREPVTADAGTPAAYRDLWALKYSVATLYDPLVAPHAFAAAYPASDFETVIGVHQPLHTKARAQLDATCPEAETFAHLRAPVADPKALLDEWGRREEHLGLLYLYCHSSPDTVGFSVQHLTSVEFAAEFKKRTVSPPCLVFLNGCHTATGQFFASTGRRGFCGLIGVETIVPYMFAHRFGAAVIASLYAGEPLGATIDRLRVQHWPLSLLYGLYAYPLLRLVPSPSFTAPAFAHENYSTLAVGDETL
jgi:hypothetical protein